jgi:manganese/iron transport system ATP-binding protein
VLRAAGVSALTARGLTVRFGSVLALQDVSLDLPAGVTAALLGPNGAGKSTLFGAAVGLVAPTQGTISVARRPAAYVPQQLDVDPVFPVTAQDVVRMGRYGALGPWRRWSDHDRALVADAMDLLGVADLAGRRFGELSGGQRQRVLLAQAAAQDAELMLLDEPLSGVDAPTREAVQDLLGRWRDEGRTVVVATHDLESAAREFDMVLCLNRRLVAAGSAASTLTEKVLEETFEGRILRVGNLLVDVAHHHHGAG